MSSALTLLEIARKRGLRLAFVTAGGGVGLFDLFKQPGCSKVMTEARMLYSQHSFASFLGHPLLDPFVSQSTANRLAETLASQSEADLSFALTCALATDRKRLGEDHGYLAICRHLSLLEGFHIPLPEATRQEQDRILSAAVLMRVHDLILAQ